MPVVSDMIQSDGVGDFRPGVTAIRRRCITRAVAASRASARSWSRTSGRYAHVHHLPPEVPVDQPGREIVVNSLKRSGVDAPISVQDFYWRCNRASRNDTTACTAPSGQAVVKYPYLDTQQTLTYDAPRQTTSRRHAGLAVAHRVVAADSPAAMARSTPLRATTPGEIWWCRPRWSKMAAVRAAIASYGLQCKRTLSTYGPWTRPTGGSIA